jgi:hypothetical protein
MPSPGKLPRSAEPPGTYCMIHTHTAHIRARANHWYNPRARLCGRANSTRARGGGFWVGNFRHLPTHTRAGVKLVRRYSHPAGNPVAWSTDGATNVDKLEREDTPAVRTETQ